MLLSLLALVLLVGLFALTAVTSAFRHLHRTESKKQLKSIGNHFFYKPLHHFFFPHHEFEGLYFATLAAQDFTRLTYAGLLGLVLMTTINGSPEESYLLLSVTVLIVLLASYFFGDFLPKMIGSKYPEKTVRLLGGIASLFLLISFPLYYPFVKLWQKLTHSVYFESPDESNVIASKGIMDLLEESNPKEALDTQEKKIFESVVSFRDRIAREVMVPRVDAFCLPASTTVREAANLLQEEGYSRTPVYKNNVDEIVGVLMWKDLLYKYMKYVATGQSAILEAPIETILKPVLYTPETKKISLLLQEFRKKQMHLAIVVDEYGGTEGIVTIEDILEEIVGEIEDEYDEQPPLFTPLPDGGWTVDARMSIYDIEDHLGISIPQEGEYDTLGGYIFHKSGSIPPAGFMIEHDLFTLEILTSGERSIGRVKIVKRNMNHKDE